MSNIKDIRIIADVPFNAFQYRVWHLEGEGLPPEEIAAVASALLSPSVGLHYTYQDIGAVPNERGGQTSMYQLTIAGQEALAWPYLKRLAMALKNSGKLAKLHVAEARDIENPGSKWDYIVDKAELSGEASSH